MTARLRAAGIPATFKEHLVLLEALDKDVIEQTPEAFYYLSRATFVKDEGLLDRFDQVFQKVFKGIMTDYGQNPVDIPEDWLKAVAEKFLTPEEMEKIKSLGDWDEIIETLKKRLEEQEKRHQGGNKWIGTGGTSPFGNSGYNPEGVRIGGEAKHGRAIKVWEKREFKNLDNTKELGTRNIKMALRRLRHRPRPAFGRTARHARVRDHIAAPVPAEGDHDDAARIAASRRRRIDRHDDPVQFDRPRAPGPFQVRDAEQGALALDHHAFQLLRRQPRPAIDVVQMRQKAGRQVLRVQRRRRPFRHRPRLGHQPPQRRDRPGRRGHRQQRRGPQPQSEPQVRQHHLRPPPGAEFVRPSGVKLRPPQTVGILGRNA